MKNTYLKTVALVVIFGPVALLCLALSYGLLSARGWAIGLIAWFCGLLAWAAVRKFETSKEATLSTETTLSERTPMRRAGAIFIFIGSGGLLIFLSPYLTYEAAVKREPWFFPVIVIPIYAFLSYGAFKLYWPRIVGPDETSARPRTMPGERSPD